MTDGPVVTLDISVLLGLSGLDVVEGNALLFGPDHQRGTDVFRAIVHPDRQGLSAPFNVEEDQETVRGAVSPTNGFSDRTTRSAGSEK